MSSGNMPVATEQISGVLVHARPEAAVPVTSALEAMPGVEVHDDLGDGRLIVIVESTDERVMADTFTDIRNTDGVLSASLTYHYTDETSFLDEEFSQ